MAYYRSAYCGSDYGEYSFNSYSVSYDYSQIPSSMTYSGYEYDTYNQPQPYYGYDPSLYYAQSYQTISYSSTTYSDPKSVVYDPNYGMSQLVISYSKLEFNEPEFDEYDPTPYDGGYDIAQTYGKPLPPSEKICYPRSDSSPNSSVPNDAVPAGSIVPLPTIVEEIDEKPITPQKNGTADQAKEEKPQTQDCSIDQPREIEDNNYESSDESEESEENHYGQSEEHERQVAPQYPSGYGLEAMDLCESLFGYWPCLERMKREHKHCCEEVTHRGNYCQENMWKGTADYLFGNPNPYAGGSGYGSGGHPVYGYERQYPTQAQYRQVDYYADESW